MSGEVGLVIRMIRAALQVAAMEMRDIPKLEPELKAPDELHDAAQSRSFVRGIRSPLRRLIF
jgi:hypothetical protein